jgi:hypothetical protein
MSYDDKGMKWLRVKNWRKYQLDNRLRSKDAPLKYVLSWTGKFADVDYVKLSMFERSLYNDMIALAGTRPLRTLPNDPTWIARSIHVSRTEMPRVPHALVTLIERGFIIPIVTEKNFEEDGENVAREGEGEREGERDCQSVNQSVVKEADASLEEQGFVVVDLEIAVHDLPCFTLLHEEFGRSEILPEPVIRRIHSALKALGKDELWMQGSIRWAARHKFWKERVVNAETLATPLINSINDPEAKMFAAQYDKYIAQRRAAGAGKR